MIYLRLFEEYNTELTLEEILMSIISLYDDGFSIYFFDANGKLTKTENVGDTEFAFYSDKFNKRNHNFKIRVFNDILSYDDVTKIMDEMHKIISLLKKQGWFLTDFDLISLGNIKNTPKEITFRKIDFEFRKNIEVLKTDKSIQSFFGNTLAEAQKKISNICSDHYVDISSDSVTFYDNSIEIDDYDFLDTSENNIDAVCDVLGADSWEYKNGRNTIVFIYE